MRASGYWEAACSDFPEAVLCESGLEGGYLVRMIREDGNSGLRQPQEQNCTKSILWTQAPKFACWRLFKITGVSPLKEKCSWTVLKGGTPYSPQAFPDP